MTIKLRAFTSPTLVLLAFDWSEAQDTVDFLGFAIQRTPGFDGPTPVYLPNRLGFDGAHLDANGMPVDIPSNQAPIQKFYWWDARINTEDRGKTFQYIVTPITGKPGALKFSSDSATIAVRIPPVEEHGVTTHFNRAVVSSQAFATEFPDLDPDNPKVIEAAEAWLANGMQDAIPEFLRRAAGKEIDGSIYHLSDEVWILPAMESYKGDISLTYNHTSKDDTSDKAISELVKSGQDKSNFTKRTHASISHDKFIVRVGNDGNAEAVLMGSANFTTDGLSIQANVLHAWEAADLAQLYLDRKRLLQADPSLSDTRKHAGWSDAMMAGDAMVRVFFPPEDLHTAQSIDAIVDVVNKAKSSVLFCSFDPTDQPLVDSIFKASDRGLMMLALINRVPTHQPKNPDTPSGEVQIEIMDRANKDHSIVGFGAFKGDDAPDDFKPERVLWPKEDPVKMVRVHHKFVVVDGETDSPTVFTGSANFSGNSLHNNDENLVEITQCPRIAQIYFSEFLRLYEHYRARAEWNAHQKANKKLTLALDNSWTKKYFVDGSPEEKARVSMSSGEQPLWQKNHLPRVPIQPEGDANDNTNIAGPRVRR